MKKFILHPSAFILELNFGQIARDKRDSIGELGKIYFGIRLNVDDHAAPGVRGRHRCAFLNYIVHKTQNERFHTRTIE